MSGTISGFNTVGINLTTNPTTIVGTISTGASTDVYGAAATNWTLVNDGVLRTDGFGVDLAGDGNVINAAGALINGYLGGVTIGQAGTVVNAGSIIATDDYGVDVAIATGQITNTANALITGGMSAIAFGPGTTILNEGTIQAIRGYGAAIYGSGGLITNASGATISGRIGIELLNADTFVNAGLLESTHASYEPALRFGAGTANLLVIDPDSTIIGAIGGFIAGDTIDIAGATITAARFAGGVLTLTNGITLVGTLALNGNFNTSEFGLSPDNDGGTAITLGNETVTGSYLAGFYLNALNTTIASGATISSTGVPLIGSSHRAWNIENHGTIIGSGPLTNLYAVQLNNFGTFENAVDGLIEGGGGVVLGGKGGTFKNAGTVEGTYHGTAILFAGSANPGFFAIDTDPAIDVTAILEPGSSLTGDIAGFFTGDTIDLAGIAANGAHFANNILTLTNNGALVGTLALAGNFNDQEIGIVSDQAGGTDITLASVETISGTYTAGVVLSAFYTTITSTASVANSASGLPAYAVFSGEGEYVTLVNSGQVTDRDSLGSGVQIDSGSVTNTSTGTITGPHYGVELFDGTLVNAGTVASTGTGFGSTGFTGGPSVQLINSGLVTGDVGATSFGAEIENQADGEISGGTGIENDDGSVYNAGTITGSLGIALAGGVVENYGTVSGTVGIAIYEGTVYNRGLISGQTGVAEDNPATLINAGTIVSALGTAIQANPAGSYIRNSGLIMNTAAFTNATDMSGKLLNYGTINAQSGFGVNLYGFASVTNIGLIEGGEGGVGGDVGVMVVAGTLDVDNSGTIASTQIGGGVAVALAQFATVINTGLISGGAGYGVQLLNGGTVTNAGTITGASGALQLGFPNARVIFDPGAVFNGVVEVQNGVGGVLELAAGLMTGTLAGFGSQFTGFTSVAIDTGALWDIAGTTSLGGNVTLTNDGTIFESGADSLAIDGDVTGTGVIILDPTTITLDGSISAGQEVSFTSAGDVLNLGDPTQFNGTITNFGAGDFIDLPNVSNIIGEEFASGVLTLNECAGSITLTFANPAVFATAPTVTPTTNGLEITLPCFVIGTRILTPRGEIPVEALSVGDMIRTNAGTDVAIKWIGTRGYDGRFIAENHLMLPVCFKRNAIAANVPVRDLWVSPGHGIYIDGVIVPAWRLINDVSIMQAASVESVTYFHIELADHDVIIAEGCPTESFFDDNCRNQFQNIAEFHALYPDDTNWGKLRCFPRVESGFHLQAIQQRLAIRAGITPSLEQGGALRGFVDQAGPDVVAGWAQSETQPETPVCLDILVKGRRVMRVLANQYRADLRSAGLGSGCHSFEVRLPANLAGPAEVRRTIDQAELALTEAALARVA